jgi:enolase
MLIKGMKIRKVFATNSLPTIEIEIRTVEGTVRSTVPMGTSTSGHEAMYFPVDDVIRRFSIVSRYFRTHTFESPADVDTTLHIIDKTPGFKEIGGNLATGVSAAFLKAFALEAGRELFQYVYDYTKQAEKHRERQKKFQMPIPLANVVGGWHGQSDIQEFMLLPAKQNSFADSAVALSEAYHDLREEIKEKDAAFSYTKNLESAWVTNLNHHTVLKLLAKVANEAGNDNALKIGLDVAASNLWDRRHYIYKHKKMIRVEQLDFITDLAKNFPITYIEDPFEENDFVSHATLTHRLSERGVLVCGDDLYATNTERLKIGIEQKSTNAVIVKPNQIGTITDTINFVEEARKQGMKTVMSHRSGTTEDMLICHLAVGLACDYVKFGISGERVAKINEMIRIEEKLKGK